MDNEDIPAPHARRGRQAVDRPDGRGREAQYQRWIATIWPHKLIGFPADPEECFRAILKAIPQTKHYSGQLEQGEGGGREDMEDRDGHSPRDASEVKERDDSRLHVGRPHFQCRFAFKTATRLATLGRVLPPGAARWAPERDPTKSTMYTQKEEGRIAGPWTDQTQVAYIPRAYRNPILSISQQWIKHRLDNQGDRRVLFIVDPAGGTGKTFLGMYLAVAKGGVRVPATIQSAEAAMQCCMSRVSVDPGRSIYIILDLPRAIGQRGGNGGANWGKWLTAIEDMKNGHFYDPRYAWKEVFCEPPKIMVTCNTWPPLSMLTADRFDIHTIKWIKFASGEWGAQEGIEYDKRVKEQQARYKEWTDEQFRPGDEPLEEEPPIRRRREAEAEQSETEIDE